MRPVYLSVGLAFLALGVYIMAESFALDYYTPLGPGPGFFPFWLAAILSTLTVAWLVQVFLRSEEPLPEGFFPSKSGAFRLVAVLAALTCFVVLGDLLGFRLTMLALLLFLVNALGRQRLPVALAVSLVGSFGVYYGFHDLMGIHLPLASIEFLENLGL